MINNLKYKNILIFILLSVSFSKSFSRISTTIDFPSNYNIIGRSLESNQVVVDQMYENKPGINIAYEHLGISRENINLYIGGEFMLGKNSQSTMAFHSLYLMPSLIFKEKYAVNTRFGLSQINTDQNNFDLNFGYVVSLGFEYQISNKMALSLSYSMYDMQNKDITDVSGFNPPLVSNIGNGIIDIDDMNLDLKYNKIGLSIDYGFEVVTKKEKNEKY
jgi:hypothetical protein